MRDGIWAHSEQEFALLGLVFRCLRFLVCPTMSVEPGDVLNYLSNAASSQVTQTTPGLRFVGMFRHARLGQKECQVLSCRVKGIV